MPKLSKTRNKRKKAVNSHRGPGVRHMSLT